MGRLMPCKLGEARLTGALLFLHGRVEPKSTLSSWHMITTRVDIRHKEFPGCGPPSDHWAQGLIVVYIFLY